MNSGSLPKSYPIMANLTGYICLLVFGRAGLIFRIIILYPIQCCVNCLDS